jgi:hypothetical protein
MEYALNVFRTDLTSFSPSYTLQISQVSHISLFSEGLAFTIEYSPTIIILLFTILGIGIIFKQNSNKWLLIFGLMSFLSIPLWSPTRLSVLNFFESFVFDRYVLFTAPFIMLIFGYGLYNLIMYTNEKKNTYLISIIIISFLIYTFFSLGTISKYDYQITSKGISPVFSDFFNENDFAFINFVDRFIPSGSSIISDGYAFRYYEGKRYFNGIEKYNTKYYYANYFEHVKTFEFGQYIIFREGFLEKQKNIQGDSFKNSQTERNLASEYNLNFFEKIFSSDYNSIYLTQSP